MFKMKSDVSAVGLITERRRGGSADGLYWQWADGGVAYVVNEGNGPQCGGWAVASIGIGALSGTYKLTSGAAADVVQEAMGRMQADLDAVCPKGSTGLMRDPRAIAESAIADAPAPVDAEAMNEQAAPPAPPAAPAEQPAEPAAPQAPSTQATPPMEPTPNTEAPTPAEAPAAPVVAPTSSGLYDEVRRVK